MRIDVAGRSHVGMKRNHNEDAFLVLSDERLYSVADGMGGHAMGEIASRIAIEELAEFYKRTSRDADLTWPFKMDRTRNYEENRLATGIKLANARIYEAASSDPNYRGMGTTIVTLHFADDGVYVGHVGDSRAYFLHGNTLEQISRDHNVVAHMQLRSANRGQRHNFIGRDRVQLLDPGEDAVQLALQAVRLLRRNFHSGEVRDPLYRRLVDLGLCHGCL